MLSVPFPIIDPVAIEIGPIVVRWYALAYLAGFLLGWRYCMRLARTTDRPPSPQDIDDFLTWAVIGVILGGRLGYVLFYNLPYYLEQPLDALKVWQGGMSFHGGLLGVIVAIVAFSWRRGLAPLALGDLIACAAPIGLFFGRIANFINGELFGRVTDVPWAIMFPRGGPEPRHPSQLYEAVLEGLVLFVVLAILVWIPSVRNRTGLLTGVFLAGYGIARIAVEFFREPDPQLGFLFAGATMGQLLSVPLVAVGIGLIAFALANPPRALSSFGRTPREAKQ
ncbi:prolipoprotein diacylglyceryl transferase [Azospirillum brasilense]|uniref:Phosphatidylglycerol--prolipoprotein diacylglyceryl transferase n=1 Tax=Azospirillum brasilense TaxID=192 RepID=A0A6L3B2G6_AZOBR|nr:prolipoprotein diacylglyceryl transferase [Azospirillum brasilense]KAA0686148.1 prolipoprotein diacylglyceryl transferase [Azospirillum brasilense]